MSSAPSTGTTVIDTGEMPTIHTVFRREFRLAGGVSAEWPTATSGAPGGRRPPRLRRPDAAPPPHRRGRTLWPILLERVPEELAPIVRPWSRSTSASTPCSPRSTLLPRGGRRSRGTRAALAELFDQLYAHLAEHLDAEEERLLPIAARAVTQEEWEAWGSGPEAGPALRSAPPFGMIQYEGDPAVVAQMLAEAPAPVRRICSPPWPGAPSVGRRCSSTAPRRPDASAGRRSSRAASSSVRPSTGGEGLVHPRARPGARAAASGRRRRRPAAEGQLDGPVERRQARPGRQPVGVRRELAAQLPRPHRGRPSRDHSQARMRVTPTNR